MKQDDSHPHILVSRQLHAEWAEFGVSVRATSKVHHAGSLQARRPEARSGGNGAERPGIDAVAGAWSETHPHRGGGSLRPEPLCGFGERKAQVMAFHAQLGDVGLPCHHITTRLPPVPTHQDFQMWRDVGSDGPPPLRLHLDLSLRLAGLSNQSCPTNASPFDPKGIRPAPPTPGGRHDR